MDDNGEKAQSRLLNRSIALRAAAEDAIGRVCPSLVQTPTVSETCKAIGCEGALQMARCLPHTCRGVSVGTLRAAPHCPRHFHNPRQFGPLFVLGKQVTFLGAGEAALRAEAELLQVDVSCRIADPPLEVGGGFQRAR